MKALYLVVFLSIMMSSCSDKSWQVGHPASISSDSLCSYSCAALTEDHKGNTVLSYVKEINDTLAYFCYSVSEDEGQTFKEPVQINSSSNIHPSGENHPKIIFKPDGNILAMWGVSNPNPLSKYSGLVFYAQSSDGGKTWSDAMQLVKDTSAYDQRYFDLALLPNGEVMAIWLDNRGKKETPGSTLFSAVTNGTKAFSNEKLLARTTCQCCRTDIYLDEKDNIHITFRDIINDSIRDIVHMMSDDLGNNFTQPKRISADNWVINACPHTGPTLTRLNNDLHFAWYTMGGGEGVFHCSSNDNGKSYSVRDTVSGKPSAKHPQITSLSDEEYAIVWDENVQHSEQVNVGIGLQIRSYKNTVCFSKIISSPSKVCEYPVIKQTTEGALVAYTLRDNGRKIIMVQRVTKL